MSIIAIVTAGYLGWAALLFVMQRSMMFPGVGLRPVMERDAGWTDGVERIWIPIAGGRVEAWFFRVPADGPAPAVIFAHGNGELIDDGLADARRLQGLGISTLLVEYPGYGRSDGRPSRQSIMDTFLAAYDSLAARDDIDEHRIVGMGRSLGGGAITDLSRHRPLRAMVLQSTFTAVTDLSKRYLVPGILVRDRFDNLEVVRTFAGPILLIHGRKDLVIPHVHSERLARAGADAHLMSLDCAHNDCPPDASAYIAELRRFFVRAGILQGESRASG